MTDKFRIASTFNDYFVNIANHINISNLDVYGDQFVNHPSVRAIRERTVLSPSPGFSFSPTNSQCVESLLSDINTRKSPGYDNIAPRFLRASAAVIASPLSFAFNNALAQCKYPSAWKKGQITPLPKNQEDDKDKTMFRPVTVLPAMNNIFERILASQLLSYFQDLFGDFLSAYRKHHSCLTTLLRLVEDWKQSRDQGELVAMVAMDLSKAFDSLPHTLLIKKLQAYGLDRHSCTFLQDYLNDRLQRVRIGDTVSTWEYNHRGIPQGSVLGPLLFNIFLNDLSFFITGVKLNAYADDQQLYSSDSDHSTLYNRLNDELSIATEWFKQNGLMANPTKFQSLILGDTDEAFIFTVDGIQIERRDDINLLGVNIDSRLTFHKHVSTICKKVNNQLQVIKRFRNLISGPTMLRLYNAFIQPVFSYCSDVWHFCSARDRDKLEHVNKQALRVVLNDKENGYDEMLRKLEMVNLEQRRVQNMLITVFKCLHGAAPSYLRSHLKERTSAYSLRGHAILELPTVKTTTYGLHSFRYFGAHEWNRLPDSVRRSETLAGFRRGVKRHIFQGRALLY